MKFFVKKAPPLTNPLGHVVLKHYDDWKLALPSPLYKSMAEHACVALTPPFVEVEMEIATLRRSISNMVMGGGRTHFRFLQPFTPPSGSLDLQ